jgi:subtilisin family serine protease
MRLLAGLVFVLLALSLLAGNSSGFTGVTADLERVLETSGPDQKIRVNVIMERHVDYMKLIQDARDLSRRERRERAVEAMESAALETQGEVRRLLAEQEAAGNASDMLVLLGVNGINVRATRSVIEEIALLEGVKSIDWDEEVPNELILDPMAEPDNLFFCMATDTSWGVKKINAPLVWELGITGAGVLIGIIDTGVNYNHVDLADHMWDGGPSYPNHGWDFASADNDPMDNDGHGTACAGIVAGDGTAGLQTGVAPDATVMALRAGNTESAMWAASDFAILHGCDVITSSMSWKYPSNPDYESWRDQAVAELAAGVIRSNSIGNQGGDPGYPIPYNIATPGNCPPAWLHPDQTLIGDVSSTMGCGAVDQSDQILYYSGRGPAAWERPGFPPYYQDYPYDNGMQMGLLKPDVCAPTDVRTLSYSNPSGYITGFGGTSAATPHLGGALCLVLSADTTLTPEMITQKIQMNAVELGAAGKDNIYGAGRIDVFAAITSNLFSLVTIEDFALDDTAGGDGDGRLEVGETSDLIMNFRASGAWADADSVLAVLSTTDPDLSILDSVSYLGSIPKGSVADNSGDPFTLAFISGSPHWTQINLHITAVPPNFFEDDSISLLIGQPDILLVDDDAGMPFEAYYQQTLLNLSRVFDEWEVETQGAPPASGPFSLNDHEVVIWFTGEDTSTADILTPEDTTLISTFLDAGGKLFITSQNLGRALSPTPFYTERLHATFLTENADNNLCTGVVDDEIGDSLRIVLQGSGGAGNASSEDRISPNPGADSCFYYTTYGGASGIKYDSGIYKVVYFGFPFEAIHGVSIYAGQDTVMARILKWLWLPNAVAEGMTAPRDYSFDLERISPNPLRSQAEISYSIASKGKISLSVYDAAGRLVKSIASGESEPGVYSARWDCTDERGERVPAGVYFARLGSGNLSVTRKLTLVR